MRTDMLVRAPRRPDHRAPFSLAPEADNHGMQHKTRPMLAGIATEEPLHRADCREQPGPRVRADAMIEGAHLRAKSGHPVAAVELADARQGNV